MRCKLCKKIVKHANVRTRNRRVCGQCIYKFKIILKTINIPKITLVNG